MVKGKNLFFRGYNNTIAHMNFVFSLLPPELTDTFVVNGCSAGGLATYTWLEPIANYIRLANPKTKVFGLPDSGFFVDYASNRTGKHDYASKIKAVVDLVNQVTPLPNTKCVADNKENQHYCLLAEHLIKYIDTPIFMSESLYDVWQLAEILNIPCITWPVDINSCKAHPDQLEEMAKFANYTKALLE
jgi:hypothetical protein